jgi:hypothetical protein
MPGSRATAANRATAVRGRGAVPRNPEPPGPYRLLVVGEKRLPGIIGPEDRKGWAFVEKVSSDAEEIEGRARSQEPADPDPRPPSHPRGAPRGGGGLRDRAAQQSHPPRVPPRAPAGARTGAGGDPHPAPRALRGRGPQSPDDSGVGLDPAWRAKLPTPLQKRFRGRRFIPLDPPDFLEGRVGVRSAPGAQAAGRWSPTGCCMSGFPSKTSAART